MKLLYAMLKVALVLVVLEGCNEEEEFQLAADASASGDAVVATSNDGGDYSGDPIIYKVPPSKRDPGNKYVRYMRAPTASWTMNRLVKKTIDFTATSQNSAPTMDDEVEIKRNLTKVSIPSIDQYPAPLERTLGPVAQRGVVAKSSPGAARREDVFRSNNRGLVDILLVMDNSGSMYIESTYIMRYLPELTKHIWRSDWRLGVVTSGPSDTCTITTASVKDAANATKLDFALDRGSVNYKYFHRDLNNYKDPRYLDPYFHYKDYKWLSYCGYSNSGSCRSDCSSSGKNIMNCMKDSYNYYNGTDYHKAQKEKKKYNPLWAYFKKAVTLPNNSSTDNGNEQLLRKLRWALEGKATTGCQGDWVRDNATVIAIVVTDEGHSCDDNEHTYCSINAYKQFVTDYRTNHPFKSYAVLASKLQSDNTTRTPNWDSDQLAAFDGYVINHRPKFEGYYVQGYFKDLPNGFQSSSPPKRVPSTNTSYHEKLSSSYGHRGLHLISMAIAAELRNIYSPMSYIPDTGSSTVRVADYVYDSSKKVSEYVYADVSACRAGDTSGQGQCFKIRSGAQGGAVELVNFSNMTHFDKKVKVAYTYGGTDVSAVPFDNSWTLSLEPDPSTVVVTVSLADGTTKTLLASDYTISGTTLSVAASKVEQLVPEGSSITITYKSPVTLQTEFTLDSQYQKPSNADIVPNSTKVTITDTDGNDRTTDNFTFNGTAITFSSGSEPAAGESFTLQYKYYGDKITSYAYTRSGNTDSSVALTCKEKDTSTVVSCSYNATDKKIVFNNASQLENGETIVITETLQQSGSNVAINDFDLSSYDYAADKEIYITLGGEKCSTEKDAPEELTVSDDTIELAYLKGSECTIINTLNGSPNRTKIKVHFMVYEEVSDDFLQMPKSFFAEHNGKYKFEYWEVKVNDAVTNDFMVDDYKITELNGVMTDSSAAMRSNFDAETKVEVIVRLYHAL